MELEFLILAGGIGRRLNPITGGGIPKCEVQIRHNLRGVDLLLRELKKIGVQATFSADNYYYKYEKMIGGTEHKMLWQKPGDVVGAILQPGHRVLTIAPDCLFDMSSIPRMIGEHIPGTISWAVTRHQMPFMEAYAGLDVNRDGSIVGRENLSITRSPTLIIEPDIIRKFQLKPREDFFYDIMPRLERENSYRIARGEKSLLNAFFLDGPIIDYGSPKRLLLAAEVLDAILRL